MTPQDILTAAALAAARAAAVDEDRAAHEAASPRPPRGHPGRQAWSAAASQRAAAFAAAWTPPADWAPPVYVAGTPTGAPDTVRTTRWGDPAPLRWVLVARARQERAYFAEAGDVPAGYDTYRDVVRTTHEWCLVREHGAGVDRGTILRRGGVGPARDGLECEV